MIKKQTFDNILNIFEKASKKHKAGFFRYDNYVCIFKDNTLEHIIEEPNGNEWLKTYSYIPLKATEFYSHLASIMRE